MAGPDQTPAASPLRLTPELLTALCDAAPVGLCVVDEAGRFAAVNGPYCRLYGYTREELLGQPMTLLVPPAAAAAVRTAFAQFLRGGPAQPSLKSRRRTASCRAKKIGA